MKYLLFALLLAGIAVLSGLCIVMCMDIMS